jgi:hypothetical protein
VNKELADRIKEATEAAKIRRTSIPRVNFLLIAFVFLRAAKARQCYIAYLTDT